MFTTMHDLRDAFYDAIEQLRAEYDARDDDSENVARNACENARQSYDARDYVTCIESLCTIYNVRSDSDDDERNERIFNCVLDAIDYAELRACRDARRATRYTSRNAIAIVSNVVSIAEFTHRDDTIHSDDAEECAMEIAERVIRAYRAHNDAIRAESERARLEYIATRSAS